MLSKRSVFISFVYASVFRSIIATYALWISDNWRLSLRMWTSERMNEFCFFCTNSSFLRARSEHTRTQFYYTPTIPPGGTGWFVCFFLFVLFFSWTIDEKFKKNFISFGILKHKIRRKQTIFHFAKLINQFNFISIVGGPITQCPTPNASNRKNPFSSENEWNIIFISDLILIQTMRSI